MVLDCNHLQVSYEGEPVLLDFSLQVGKGEIIALVGESGSGKTTAIRAIMGLLPVDGAVTNGDLHYCGQSMQGFSPKEWQALRGKDISMIFQDAGSMLNPIRTIGSQFVEYIRTHEKMSKKDAWQRGCVMLEQMGLYDGNAIMKSIPSQLSGGMRQRVGIAMAMTFQPQLLVADEPTSALDVTIQAQIVKQMLELRDKFSTSIILVTHNLGVATYMADRILVMHQGRVVEEGDRDHILHHAQQDYTKQLLKAVPDLEGVRYV